LFLVCSYFDLSTQARYRANFIRAENERGRNEVAPQPHSASTRGWAGSTAPSLPSLHGGPRHRIRNGREKTLIEQREEMMIRLF
jgi:hypothetical protein